MRRARRVDGNHRAIVKALREVPGCSVVDTSAVGNGFGDLLVGLAGRNYMLEVKDPSQPPSRRKLRASQILFRSQWTGHYAVVETPEQALHEVGIRER